MPIPPVAQAHVAIDVMPTYFAENPCRWFQTVEAQFPTARPTPNNGQKYFHLLQKLLGYHHNVHNHSSL